MTTFRSRMVVAAGAAVVVVGAIGASVLPGSSGEDQPRRTAAPSPLQPLLGPANPSGPPQRGTFVRDPKGQIENLAGSGLLLAWSVRTPADAVGEAGDDRPIRMPASTTVVVFDERTRGTTEIPYPGAAVVGLGLHPPGADGTSELGVVACRSRRVCKLETVILSPAASARSGPVVESRQPTPDGEGTDDGADPGRQIDVAGDSPRRAATCSAAIAFVDEASGERRALPHLPPSVDDDECVGLRPGFVVAGRYAFVEVDYSVPAAESVSRLDGTTVYGLDLQASPQHWVGVASPLRSTDGSTGTEIGPAITPSALYWQEVDMEVGGYSLKRIRLPEDLAARSVKSDAPNWTEAVKPEGTDGCDLVATDVAFYELANPRCAVWPEGNDPGEIRRLVAPLFSSSPDR